MSLRYKELAISFEDIDFEDDAEEPTEPCNIECYVSITARGSNRLLDIITLDEQTNKANVAIGALEDMLQLIFKKKNSDEMIGSISIPFELFFLQQQQRIEQWITLFDDPDDDVFDGELGDNDGDIPKSLMHFELIEDDAALRPMEFGMSGRILPSDILEHNTQERGANSEELFVEAVNIDNYSSNLAKFQGAMNEFFPEDAGEKAKKINYQSNDNLILNNSFSFDQDQNPLFKEGGSGFNSLRKSFKEDSIYDEKRLKKNTDEEGPAINHKEGARVAALNSKPSEDSSKAIAAGTSKPLEEPARGAAVNGRSNEEDQKDAQQKNEKKVSEADKQALQQMLNRMNFLNDLDSEAELREKNKKYEEELRQLSAEVKRLREGSVIAETLKLSLQRKEGQYLDLLRLHQNNLESFEQKAKALNSETAALKEKILDLEKDKLELFGKFKVERDSFLTDFTAKNKEVERERFRVEELASTNATLETLIQDLKRHLDSTHNKLTEEMDKNTRLLHQNDEIVLSLKKVQEEVLGNQKAAEEQTLQLEESLRLTKAKLKEKQDLIEELNLKIKVMTSELDIQKEINKSLESEVELSAENLLLVNKEIEELKIEKNQEATALNEKLLDLNINYNAGLREKNNLKLEIENLRQEKSRWEALDLYHQLINAEKKYEESENQRSWLQEQLTNLTSQFEQKSESMFNEYCQNIEQHYQTEIEALEKKLDEVSKESLEKSKKISELALALNEYRLKSMDQDNQNSSMQELTKTLQRMREENLKINEEKDGIQRDLYKVTEELINQTNINLEQTKHINQLGMEAERLRNDLDTALRLIPPLGDPDRQYKKSYIEEEDELDIHLNDFIASNNVPVGFSKLSPGEYKFGSKMVSLRILNGKLVVRVGGGYMILQEFLRLFTVEEIQKFKERQAEERSRREAAELERKEEKRGYVDVLANAGKKKQMPESKVRDYRENNSMNKSPVTARQTKKDVAVQGQRPSSTRKY